MKSGVAVSTTEERKTNFCSDEPGSVDAACQQVRAAIEDRRENGGNQQQIRSAALRLIKKAFEELDEAR